MTKRTWLSAKQAMHPHYLIQGSIPANFFTFYFDLKGLVLKDYMSASDL